MRTKFGLLAFAALAAATVTAARAEGVSLAASVMQDKAVVENGKPVVKLVPAAKVAPGDAVTYVLAYRNGGAKRADNVVLTNPVPANLEFVEAAGAQVSVDGGKRYGALSELNVVAKDGTARAAAARDVTHVRWALAALAPGAAGQVAYRARVK